MTKTKIKNVQPTIYFAIAYVTQHHSPKNTKDVKVPKTLKSVTAYKKIVIHIL